MQILAHVINANKSGFSVTPSATMRWTTLRGIEYNIDAALSGVNVNVTMVLNDCYYLLIPWSRLLCQ
jgi:hypothetical protein